MRPADIVVVGPCVMRRRIPENRTLSGTSIDSFAFSLPNRMKGFEVVYRRRGAN